MTLEDRINRLAKPIKLGLLAIPAVGVTFISSTLPADHAVAKAQELVRVTRTYGHYGVQPLLYAIAIGAGWKGNFNWAVGTAVAGWTYKMCTWVLTSESTPASFEHYFQRGLTTALLIGGLAAGSKFARYLSKHVNI